MINSIPHSAKRIPTVFVLVASLGTLACFEIPVRVTQVAGPGLAQIQAGQSTRAHVLRDWGHYDNHADSGRLFIGTVVRSTKVVESLGPVYAGSYRDSHTLKAFIEFDDHGVVTKSYSVKPGDQFRACVSWVRRTNPPPLDLTKPIELKTRGPIASRLFSSNYWGEYRAPNPCSRRH